MHTEYLKTVRNLFPDTYAELIINGYDKMREDNEVGLEEWDEVLQDDIIVYATTLMLIEDELVRRGTSIKQIEKTLITLNQEGKYYFIKHYGKLNKILEGREHFEQCKHLQEATINRMAGMFALTPEQANKELKAMLNA